MNEEGDTNRLFKFDRIQFCLIGRKGVRKHVRLCTYLIVLSHHYGILSRVSYLQLWCFIYIGIRELRCSILQICSSFF